MASTIENGETQSDVLSEQTEGNLDVPGDENNVESGENTTENGRENVGIDDEKLGEVSKTGLVDFETFKADEPMNTGEQITEIIEIEEKVIIETLDEAKPESNAQESAAAEQNCETIETLTEELSPESETKSKVTQPESAEKSESTKEPESAKEPERAEVPDSAREPEWLDLLGNGLLKKKIIKAGNEDSSRPAAGQEVCVKSEGTLPSGERVDVNLELKFIIGDGDVITAFDLCVPTMLENEICVLVTAPRFAYGTIGREDDDEGDVPPDSEVTYTLELLSVKPGPDVSNLTDEQRIELGDLKRERGNDLFRREEYSLAVHSYTRALKYLGSSTDEAVVELKVKCWNNISASHLKVQEYIAAKNACDSVLEVDPSNVKALFRKGKVLAAQGEYEESVELLKKANALDPENKLIRRELYLVRQKCDENKQKERSMYQRMVSGLNDDNALEDFSTFFTWPVILGITGVALGGVIAAFVFTRR